MAVTTRVDTARIDDALRSIDAHTATVTGASPHTPRVTDTRFHLSGSAVSQASSRLAYSAEGLRKITEHLRAISDNSAAAIAGVPGVNALAPVATAHKGLTKLQAALIAQYMLQEDTTPRHRAPTPRRTVRRVSRGSTSGVRRGRHGNTMRGSGDLLGGMKLSGEHAQKVLQLSRKIIEARIPYSWGGGTLTGPSGGFDSGYGVTGFDCSGLARYMTYQLTGKEIPRVANDQFNAGHVVPRGQAQPGDLLFPDASLQGGSYAHVTVYIGGGKIIEAPAPGQLLHIADAPPGLIVRY